jgi:hypothetical protein
MKILRSLLGVSVIIVIAMISCSKSGTTGPTGPKGPAGPDSVYSSQWTNLNLVWNPTDSNYEETITAASVTKGILDSGIILTYVNLPDTTTGTYFVSTVASLSAFFYEDYSVGSIFISSFRTDYSSIVIKYRYVTIPGSKTIGNGANRTYNGYSAAELKSMSYDKVQQIVANKND